MIEIGRLCLKIAGRDAGKKCVVIDEVDKNYVLIDGQTRRKKCNRAHLEPLKEVLKVRKGASHEGVAEALKELGIVVKEKVNKVKKAEKTEAPKKA